MFYVSQKAQRAQKFFRLTAKNLGLTDYTDYTDYACLAASGISLLIPQKAKVKYRKKQKQNTAKSKSKMPQKTKINFVDSNIEGAV
jgi:hypothetical protein